MSTKFWKGIEELKNDAEFVRLKNNEFPEHLPLDEVISGKAADSTTTPRRDFLKFLGFSVAAASLAACETPVNKTIPYLVKPEEITPGVANYYASSYHDGYDYCSILVKTREGRPIKIEGNTLSSVTKGGTNARVQASVLSLYDSARLRKPMADGAPASWETIDVAIKAKLGDIAAQKGNIRILSSTIISPSTKKVMEEFASKNPNTKHITYDAVSCSAMRQANKESFGVEEIPTYNFDKANVIVSFDCDFLVNWISPIEHARGYAETRKLNGGKKEMSRHIQFESALSVTGSNADKRIGMKPSMQGAAIANLYNAVAKLSGGSAVNAGSSGDAQKEIETTAKALVENKGKSVVVCGINNVAIQNLVNGINSMLGNYGTTIDLNNPCMLRQGNDADLVSLLAEMSRGEVSALFIYNSNPVYTLGDTFADAMKKVPLSVSFADRADETASLCKYICPDHHPLESWNDAEPRKGFYSLCQPTISPLFSTRQMQESLLTWSGNVSGYRDYMIQHWSSTLLKGANWNKTLQDGVLENSAPSASNNTPKFETGSLKPEGLNANTPSPSSGFELVIYEKTGPEMVTRQTIHGCRNYRIRFRK